MTSRPATALRVLATCGAVLVLPACSDGAGPAPAPRFLLRAESDTEQVVLVGHAAAAPRLLVVDSSGHAGVHVSLRFTIEDGRSPSAVVEAVTDSTGRAALAAWPQATAPGLQLVRAEVPGESSPLAFRATIVPQRGPLRVDAACPLPDSLFPSAWTLPRTTARLRARLPLSVVAIGSSSTVGTGASTPDSAYPALLEDHLRRAFPSGAVSVRNAGRGGQRLAQLRSRFHADVYPYAPQLVVLQTGTNDAVQGVPVDSFADQLRAALGELATAGTDVLVLDSQRYPGAGEGAAYQAYQDTMRRLTTEAGVPIARRYAWMSELYLGGTYTYAQLLASDMFHPSDLTYSCTGRLLAEGVVAAVAATVP